MSEGRNENLTFLLDKSAFGSSIKITFFPQQYEYIQ
jgi:hypothetical protein